MAPRKKIVVIDTSILCCYLKVPGKETAGRADDRWDHQRASNAIETEEQENSQLVLPIATLIETGNHIAQKNCYNTASALARCLEKAISAQSPWAAFTAQTVLWDHEPLQELAQNWPDLAKTGLSIGDATIKNVADHYARIGWDVEILTADKSLKAYQPAAPTLIPRRRQK